MLRIGIICIFLLCACTEPPIDPSALEPDQATPVDQNMADEGFRDLNVNDAELADFFVNRPDMQVLDSEIPDSEILDSEILDSEIPDSELDLAIDMETLDQNIDECATNNGNCGDPQFYTCTNNDGATPTCADIDECATNNGECGDPEFYTCTNNEASAPTCSSVSFNWDGEAGDQQFFTALNWDQNQAPNGQSHAYVGGQASVLVGQAQCAHLLIDVGSELIQTNQVLNCPLDIRGRYNTNGSGINPAGRKIELRGALGPNIPWIDTWNTPFIFWDGARFENPNMVFRIRNGNRMTFRLSANGFTPIQANRILEPQTWLDVDLTIDLSRYHFDGPAEFILMDFNSADSAYAESREIEATWIRGLAQVDGRLLWDYDEAQLKVLVDSNSPPSDVTVSLSPSAPTSQDQLTANAQTAHQTAQLNYQWFINEVLQAESSSVLNHSLQRGDQVRVEVTASTSLGESEMVSATVIIANSAPLIQSLSLSPEVIRANDNISALLNAEDLDEGDQVSINDCVWELWQNGWQETPILDSSTPLEFGVCGERCEAGDIIRVGCQVSDGTAISQRAYSSPKTINNSNCLTSDPNCIVTRTGKAPIVDQYDYTYWYWPSNHRPVGSSSFAREMHFLSAYYALALNEASAELSHFGLLNAELDVNEASLANNSLVNDQESASLSLQAQRAGQVYTVDDSLRATDNGNDIARMIDGGRYMNQIELPNLSYAGDDGLKGIFTVAAMPRHLSFSHKVQKGTSAALDSVSIHLGGAALASFTQIEEVEAGRALRLSDPTGAGWLFVVYDQAGFITQLSFNNGVLLAERSTIDGSAVDQISLSLVAIPLLALSEALEDLYLHPNETAPRYTPLNHLGSSQTEPEVVNWDEKTACYKVNLWSLARAGLSGDRNFDSRPELHNWYGRHLLELKTNGLGELAIPLLFSSAPGVSLNITGGVASLRDLNGEPIGVPVQISKNWHDGANNFYHFYAQPKLHGTQTEHLELTIASSRWGESAYAASHAQLSLIGYYSAGGHWDESALGCFGESITYDPDVTLGRAMMDDVRPFLVQTGNRWTWTGNVGGADFLRYTQANAPQQIQRLGRVRSVYHQYGPNLTEVSYAGLSADGKIQATITSQLGRTDDLVRNYYHFEYEFLDDVVYDRLALFQMAADRYADNGYTRYAYGNADAVLIDQASNTQAFTGYAQPEDRGIELSGDAPWVTLYHNTKQDGNLPELYADLGFVVREFEAHIGDVVLTTPHINVSRTNNGQPQSSFELGLPHEEASAWCGLPCQDQTRFIPAGSLVKATIEYLVIPADKSRYYGQSDYLNQTSVDTYRSAEMMQMLARDNQISINMITGGLLKHYPLELQANYGALAVEFSLSGGLGYIPLSIKGLNRYDGWQLQELVDGQWNLLDQSVIGNDYWQSTYDPSQDSYTLSFNLKAQALPKTYRLIWLE